MTPTTINLADGGHIEIATEDGQQVLTVRDTDDDVTVVRLNTNETAAVSLSLATRGVLAAFGGLAESLAVESE